MISRTQSPSTFSDYLTVFSHLFFIKKSWALSAARYGNLKFNSLMVCTNDNVLGTYYLFCSSNLKVFWTNDRWFTPYINFNLIKWLSLAGRFQMIVVIQYNVEESMNDWKTYNLIPSHMHLWASWAYAVAVHLAQPCIS